MGTISTLLKAGIKKVTGKAAAKQSTKKSMAQLQKELKDVNERLAKGGNPRKEYYTVLKRNLEKAIKANSTSMKDRGLGGPNKSMAKKLNEPYTASQNEATKRAKIEATISKAKKKEGRYNKRRNELREQSFKEPDKQSRLNDADYEVQKAAKKNKRTLDKAQKEQDRFKKPTAAKKDSKMQSTDFKKKGLSKKQVSKSNTKKILKSQKNRSKSYTEEQKLKDLLEDASKMKSFKKQAD